MQQGNLTGSYSRKSSAFSSFAKNSFDKNGFAAYAVIVFFYLAVILIADPSSGDFPLNDDWAYGEAVRFCLATGKLENPAACAASVTHVLMGVAVCKLFGFSYVALRWLSLGCTFIGVCFFYDALLGLTRKRALSLVCALLYGGNPIVLNIAFSFMTESTGFAFIAAFFSFWVRALTRRSALSFVLSLAALTLAICTRQTYAIFAPMALGLIFATPWATDSVKPQSIAITKSAKPDFLARILAIIAMSATTFGAAYLTDRFMTSRAAVTNGGQESLELYNQIRAEHLAFVGACLQEPFKYALMLIGGSGDVLSYCGVFVLPLLAGSLLASSITATKYLRARAANRVSATTDTSAADRVSATTDTSAANRVSAATDTSASNHVTAPVLSSLYLSSVAPILSALYIGLAAANTLTVRHKLMPFAENIWRVTSVGALGLMGIAIPALRKGQRGTLTAVSYIAGALLLERFFALAIASSRRFVRHIATPQGSARAALRWSVLVAFFISVGFLSIESLVRCTDRYYLLALLPALLLLAMSERYRRNKINIVTVIALVAWLCYGIFALQDYMSHNRARWDCLRTLEGRGASFRDIDGGAEYNIVRGLDIYLSHYRGEPPRNEWRWWPVRGEKYIVAFNTIPGYKAIYVSKYFSLLTMSEHEVVALERVSE